MQFRRRCLARTTSAADRWHGQLPRGFKLPLHAVDSSRAHRRPSGDGFGVAQTVRDQGVCALTGVGWGLDGRQASTGW